MRTGKVLYIVAVIAVVMPRASHQQQGAVGVLPAQSGCPQHHECVDRNLCLNGKVITDGSGLLDVRITSSVLLGTVQHCLEPHKVCCSVPGTVDPNRHPVGGIAGSTGVTTSTFCNEGHDCVPTYLCHDGELNTSGIGILNPRNRPTSVTVSVLRYI
ncbi:uncharacterized protein LOC121871094 [Homarus americanus]|uniref:uncharacterized protein LOC121871094 n=1 Tax=Homarus americanus TaxID=6706 RepID=UPI001C453605|nr:uncharacterized protein LOC121871094 [Homarus americanus]